MAVIQDIDAAEVKIVSVPDGHIRDYIDGTRFFKDNPEEHVRQTVEKRLVNEYKYPRKHMEPEFGLHVGSSKPRVDIAIWEPDVAHTQENVKIVIECKKESVTVADRNDGVGQLKSYMSACLNCEWGMWTNSKDRQVFIKIPDPAVEGGYKFEERNDIPFADGTIGIGRPKRSDLRVAAEDNLLFAFRACHDHIFAQDGMQKQPAFFELLKLIFCKIEDEHTSGDLEFYAGSKEPFTSDGQAAIYKRVSKIFERVKKKAGSRGVFKAEDKLELTPRTVAWIVKELQNYSLLRTNIDVKGKAYEEIVGSNLRGDRGEFFTPRNVMEMTVAMIDPKPGERVLDSSCGTGGFIVTAMTHAMKTLEADYSRDIGKVRADWDADEAAEWHSRVSEMAHEYYFGFDISPELVKATRMNMVMNNDGSGNILRTDSLLPPREWDSDFRRRLAAQLGTSPDELRNHVTIDYFDVIVTNPPFGSKIAIKDYSILEQYELARTWTVDDKGHWSPTNRYQSSVPPEILFVERTTQFLKPGGRMGIVLPDSILSSPGLEYVRAWILQNHRLVASVDLNVDTFQPHNGTQTSVLILQKFTPEEKASRKLSAAGGAPEDYNIFMALVEKVGHDKRGNPVFARNENGQDIEVSELDAQGDVHKRRVIDDQTLDVPTVFSDWKKQEGISW